MGLHNRVPGLFRSPLKEKALVSYAKHTTRYGELTGPAGGLLFNVR